MERKFWDFRSGWMAIEGTTAEGSLQHEPGNVNSRSRWLRPRQFGSKRGRTATAKGGDYSSAARRRSAASSGGTGLM